MLIFSGGLHIPSTTYCNLSIKGETYQLDWFTSLMQWKWLFLSQSKFFNQTSHRKTKQIQKTKCEKSFAKLTEKYLKIEGYVNVYCGKMFVRNYFSGCSEVLSKINFVISKMKVYLINFSLLNIHEATRLLDLEKPLHHYSITHISVYLRKLLASLNLKQ